MRKRPLESVVVVRVMPCSLDWALTAAPAIGAPVVSVTVPSSVPEL